MTTRELEVENRLTTLETKVEELMRLLDGRKAFWMNLVGSVVGGSIIVFISKMVG